MSDTNAPQWHYCAGTLRSGERCPLIVKEAGGHCGTHDPVRQALRRDAKQEPAEHVRNRQRAERMLAEW